MRATILTLVLLCLPATPAQPSRFVFQNNFWVNLHHLVRGDARRLPMKLPLALPLDQLDQAQRTTWQAALDAYGPLTEKDLVFDPTLIAINDALAMITDSDAPSGVPDDIRKALVAAAPIARQAFWPAAQRRNAEWIASVQDIVGAHEREVTTAVARAFHTDWPSQPILVDVTSEAGPVGAYTIDGPRGFAAHTTIASTDERIRGDMAVEILFHEATHSIDSAIVKLVENAASRQSLKAPNQLWHALLFYTVGHVVQRELGHADDPTYKPYADRFGVYERGWQSYRAALERDWLPYLGGQRPFDEALAALVKDAQRQQEGRP